MKTGDLVKLTLAHEGQEPSRVVIVTETAYAWPEDRYEETMNVTVLDLETGVKETWYDWQLEVISESD